MAKTDELPKDETNIMEGGRAITVKGHGVLAKWRTYPGNEYFIYHDRFGRLPTKDISVDCETALIWDTTKFRGAATMGKRQVEGFERLEDMEDSMTRLGAVLIEEKLINL